MSENGILVDYTYCTGCSACEVACKQEYGRKAGAVGGVKVMELIHELPSGKLDITYYPIFTKVCSFCAPRVKKGVEPACVIHCMANVLKFGPVEELARESYKNRKCVLWKKSGE
ncbi:MAG: oxidoreductase [Desulfuromonadales bacterium]